MSHVNTITQIIMADNAGTDGFILKPRGK
jgi:hypothetical protein